MFKELLDNKSADEILDVMESFNWNKLKEKKTVSCDDILESHKFIWKTYKERTGSHPGTYEEQFKRTTYWQNLDEYSQTMFKYVPFSPIDKEVWCRSQCKLIAEK